MTRAVKPVVKRVVTKPKTDGVVTHLGRSDIEIREITCDTFHLHVGGVCRAILSARGNQITLNWQIYGPQIWPTAKLILQGLLDLSVFAETLGTQHDLVIDRQDKGVDND